MTQSALFNLNVNRVAIWLNTHPALFRLIVMLAVAFAFAVLAQSAIYATGTVLRMPPDGGGGGCGGPCAAF